MTIGFARIARIARISPMRNRFGRARGSHGDKQNL
jgi:hypothetical protein